MKIISKNKNAGFTLIELMVTIVIVGIFASIAVPSFSALIRDNRIPITVNEFVSALILTRSEALKRSRDVTLCASNNQTSCSGTEFSLGWIVYVDCDDNNELTAGDVDCNDDGTADAGEGELIKVHDGFNKVYINNGGSFITFRFSGRPNLPTTFNVGHVNAGHVNAGYVKDTPVKNVVISSVGRVRTEDH